MAIPSSGPLSMQMFNTEFGLGNNLNAYRGKGIMPATGPISFSQLYGASASVTVSAVVQDAGFGTTQYDRGRSPSGQIITSAGSLSAQPFNGQFLRLFGTNTVPKVYFAFEGNTLSFLSGKRFLVDGVEVAFTGQFTSGQGYFVDYTLYTSVSNRPVFTPGSTHTLTFA